MTVNKSENTENIKGKSQAGEEIKLKCINIDCVFNSSAYRGRLRNTCRHPNLKVESSFADLTIAICSEFRSKKDYVFEKPATLVELKTGNKSEIIGIPDPTLTHTEKITSEDLEKSIQYEQAKQPGIIETTEEVKKAYDEETLKPVVIDERSEKELLLSEHYKLTTDTSSNFLILRRFYRSFLRKGVILSIIAHLFVIWLIYLSLVPKDENNNLQGNQRIVVVSDIETPKFEPPDIDKKEEPEIKTDDGTTRPEIKPKNIVPKIKRPKDKTEEDSAGIVKNQTSDSLKRVTDSLLAAQNKSDTSRYIIPDSLKTTFGNDVTPMTFSVPPAWKITDYRTVGLQAENFKGVIVNADTLSEDPSAVNIFIEIDDPKLGTFNKTTFKNPFEMDDSTYSAYTTDPRLTGNQRISYKFYIHTDQTGLNNIYVDAQVKKDLFDKYRKIIDAIVRTIRLLPKPKDTMK